MNIENTLSDNMKRQYDLNAKINALIAEKKELGIQSLKLIKELGLKRFASDNLVMELRSNNVKIGVDENLLASFMSLEEIERIKKVPVDVIVKAIKEKILSAAAIGTVITIKGPEFVLVRSTNPGDEKDKEQMTL